LPGSTRDRIVVASAELFRRQGYAGTGLKQIAAAAAAPFGSIYHFFPGGKDQLTAEVMRTSGRVYQDLVESVLRAAPDPVTAAGDVFAAAAMDLRATDYGDACPIAAIALEVASTNDDLRVVTAAVFDCWLEAGARFFSDAGVEPTRARELAILLVELLEGAFLLCRAGRTTEPLEVAGRAVQAAVAASVPL
jgi:AcrR family transcriptional regulator